MKQSVGAADRALRSSLGIALSLMVLIDHPMRWFGLIGLIPLLTGVFSTCPLYAVFGIKNTRAVELI